ERERHGLGRTIAPERETKLPAYMTPRGIHGLLRVISTLLAAQDRVAPRYATKGESAAGVLQLAVIPRNRLLALGSLEQFSAAFKLAVVRIFHFDPTGPAIISDVVAVFPLRHDSFQVEFARFRIQTRPVRFQIVEIEQPKEQQQNRQHLLLRQNA